MFYTRPQNNHFHYFLPAEINKNIFHLKNLLHTKISVEKHQKSRELIQCTNRQDYGHSKSYCAHPPRCVRCVGHHLTSACTQSKDQPPTCTLCGDNHTANYRGCYVHKNLQRLHRNSSNFKTNTSNVSNVSNVNSAPAWLPPRSHQSHII